MVGTQTKTKTSFTKRFEVHTITFLRSWIAKIADQASTGLLARYTDMLECIEDYGIRRAMKTDFYHDRDCEQNWFECDGWELKSYWEMVVENYRPATPVAEIVQPPKTVFMWWLPVPPSNNVQYATVNGHRIKSRVGRQFSTDVKEVIFNEASDFSALVGKGLEVNITVYFPPNNFTKSDVDNRVKAAQDSVFEAINEHGLKHNKVYGLDDRQVVDGHAGKRPAYTVPNFPNGICKFELIVADWQPDKPFTPLLPKSKKPRVKKVKMVVDQTKPIAERAKALRKQAQKKGSSNGQG